MPAPGARSVPAGRASHASWALEQANDVDLDAVGAWGVCSGDGVSAIAILDNGVQMDHPDLVGNVLPGADTTSDCAVGGTPFCDGRPRFPECEVHGTAVAGSAVALVGNGLGTDLGDPGRDDLHGDGFLQAQATLEYARDNIFSDGFEDGTTLRWSETSGAAP